MRSSGHARLTALAAAIVLVGCAALAPQYYAPDIAPPTAATTASSGGVDEAGTGAPRAPAAAARPPVKEESLDDAIANARFLQKQYAAVVQSLANSNTGLSATMLGLGTVGGIKAMSHPNSRDIGGLAALLGGLYVAGTTLVPPERAPAFRAGVLALECAIGSSVALNEPSLPGLIDEVQLDADPLNVDILLLEQWAKPKTVEKVSGGPASDCNKPAIACGAIQSSDAGDIARYQRRCADLEAARAKRCTAATRTESSIPADPEVVAYLSYAKTLRTNLDSQLTAAAGYAGQMSLAGSELRGRTRAIEEAVAREAAQTQPNVVAIKAAAASSAEIGMGLISVPKLTKPPAATSVGQATSSNGKIPGAAGDTQRLRGSDRDEFLDTRSRIDTTATHVRQLQNTLARMQVRQARSRSLEGCTVPGMARPVAVAGAGTDPAKVEPSVLIDDALRLRIAPMLGIDPKAGNATQLVNQALSDCHNKDILPDDPGQGQLSGTSLSKLVLGSCKP
ncbi:hypothetical protein CDN99_05130 [Roseateles aquatilis]|uniref:Uncharacterized protein n=1 Tax=Roseateles aquatilis TaxID=431061 RepID=A0A246JNS3_9BURK|nr:hypothetical protein [Roseateles aquatilis]OWQ93819.1 hypothetical protein CDN99_05130 [Roseateles aquatilis]